MTSTCLKRPLTLGLLALCGLSCGLDFVSVGVTVKNLTPDISSLYVYGQIDGRFETEGNEFTQQLGHFTLQVPVAAIGAGQFTINAAGRANDRCKLSAGRVDTHISRDVAYSEAEMNLVLLPSKLCTQLTTVTPALAPTEKPITLTLDGQNFAEGTTVTVAGVKATSIQVSSSTRLTATIPAASGTYGNAPVVVLTPDGQSTTRSDLFGYYARQISFSATHLSLPPGTLPIALAVADFNRDSRVDLAVANHGGSNVTLLLGSGAGVFGPPNSLSVGANPRSIAVGDFDQDGKPDMAVANEKGNSVSVLIGDGTGGFVKSSLDFAPGASPECVAVGDFDLDGKSDLAVALWTDGTVRVLFGNGLGGFPTFNNFKVGLNPLAVAVGNLNQDAKLDLIASNYSSSSVSVLLGNGLGGFSPATDTTVGTNPIHLAVGDFNVDGKIDVAVTNSSSDDVSVLIGNGTGQFGIANKLAVGVSPRSVAVADFNGDGKLDVVVGNNGDNNVSVVPGIGDGGFGAASKFNVGTAPYYVAVGDFNQDGKPDLAVANYVSNNVTILINTSR